MDTLDLFSTIQDLVVNLNKTNIVAFNTSKAIVDHNYITNRDKTIDIDTSYTYLGVLFSRPRFSM